MKAAVAIAKVQPLAIQGIDLGDPHSDGVQLRLIAVEPAHDAKKTRR